MCKNTANMESPAACPEKGTEVRKTCCGICNQYSHCGIDAYVRDGKIVRVEGSVDNPHSHGTLCPKGAGIRQYIYNPERVLHPLRRIGEKGEGKFEPISWEEAYRIIAEKLGGYKARFGPESVAFFSGFSKWYRPVLQRLAESFGTPNYMTEGSTCQEAHKMAWWLVFGEMAGPDVAHAGLVLVWSRNPFYSTMENNRVYYEQLEKGVPFIVVDPRKTSLSQRAVLHLQLRPGTDGALALGMARVIIREKLYDLDFVRDYVEGFEEFARLADAYTPERVEAITGVPGDKMVEAARLYATVKPAALHTSAAPVVHHVNGIQNYRAVISLAALTGNYDVTGGNRVLPHGYLLVSGFTPCNEAAYVGRRRIPIPAVGHREFPVWADFLPEQGQAMALPEYIRTGKPYPIKAIFGVGMNHMMWQDSAYMLDTLKQLEFFVDVDLFLTETARYADLVLPACTSVERSDVKIFSDGYVQCFPPAIAPLGESRHDIQILLELAKALGLQDPHLQMSYEEYMNFILEPTGLTVREIQEHGGIMKPKHTLPPYEERKYRKQSFPTPSGKVELVSRVLARYAADYGYDTVPVYRSFQELYPQYSQEQWPLLMCTGSRKPQLLHTRTYRMPWLAGLEGTDLLEMNPGDAEQLEIGEGDRVQVVGPAGQISATAHLTATVLPGVVHMYHGNQKANVSRLMCHDYLDPISGYPGYRSFPCRVQKLPEGGDGL